jgi:hypothetical protein
VQDSPFNTYFDVGLVHRHQQWFLSHLRVIGRAYDARKRAAGLTKREQFPIRHDKAVRAQSIHGTMELDGLYVPARAPWLPDLKAELLAFPTGKHDDQVDALGLVGQLLDKWAPGGVPKVEPGFFRPPPIDLLETQLDLVAKLGLELYAQHHIGKPDED